MYFFSVCLFLVLCALVLVQALLGHIKLVFGTAFFLMKNVLKHGHEKKRLGFAIDETFAHRPTTKRIISQKSRELHRQHGLQSQLLSNLSNSFFNKKTRLFWGQTDMEVRGC